MDEKIVRDLIENEKEWRKHLVKEMTIIRKDLTNLRIKVAALGFISGLFGNSIVEIIKHAFK